MQEELKNILERAEFLVNDGKLEEASALLRENQTDILNLPEALNILGVIAFHKGDAGQAIDHLARALQLDGANADVITNLVQIYLSLDRKEEALRFLDALAPATLSDPQILRLREELAGRSGTHLPLVSILIPAYNHAAFLPEAIESALSQGEIRSEILVIDDGSTDDTLQVIQSFSARGVKAFSQPNQGEGAACNAGIRHSRGQYIFWLDADDQLAPEALPKLLSILEANPKAFFAFSDILLMDEHGHPTGKVWEYGQVLRGHLTARLFEEARSPIPGRASTLVRRDLYERFRLFDEDLRVATDTEFLARLLSENDFRVVHVPEPLYRYRILYDRILKDQDARERSCLAVHERLLSRASPERFVPDLAAKRAAKPSDLYWAKLSSAFACEKLWRLHREEGGGEVFRKAAMERLRECDRETPGSDAIRRNLEFLSPEKAPSDRPRLGVQAPNDTFLKEILNRLEPEFQIIPLPSGSPDGLAEAMKSCDLAWFEWCESPLVSATRLPRIVPIVCRLHSYEAFGTRPEEVDWSRVDRLIFVSPKVRDLFFSRFHINQRSVVIPNGLDFSRFPLAPGKRYGKKVAYVGSISYKKGPQLLLQCFKAIHDMDPEYSFHVAGEFQEIRSRLYVMEMLPRLKLPVTFHGQVSDMPTWLADKDFIISTSLFESFQYAVAEGIACGLMPLVHTWPGSEGLYPRQCLFATAEECAALVRSYEKSDRIALAQGFRHELELRFDLGAECKKISALIKETMEESRKAPEVILTRKPFLTREDLPRLIRAKRLALRKSGLDNVVRKVLIHTPPSGGFRYYAENLYCAFKLLGLETRHLRFSESAEECIRRFGPDLFITASAPSFLSRLPLPLLSDLASRGKMLRLVWAETFKPLDGIHEMNQESGRLVQQGLVGDLFFAPVHSRAVREEYAEWDALGYLVHSIPMAANPVVHLPKNASVKYDIGFIGTNSPTKQKETRTYLLPLLERHTAMLCGDHWGEGIPPVPQNQAAGVYGRVRICPNFHHDFQKGRQLQLNERTFVIPACGGFEIMDESPILCESFTPEEMVQARSPEEWLPLHEEWLRRDGERMEIAARAHRRIQGEHTYFDRVIQMLDLVRRHKGH
ncbi:MAG: glycosyltransferase [Deltaproteobacteria bacterium]|nr:glycosyltransferase [Deltaproteobacteria bacterium]